VLSGHRELIRFPSTVPSNTLLRSSSRPGLYCSTRIARRAIPLLVIGVYVLSRRLLLSVGLAACADLIFRARSTVTDGLAVARSRFSQICGWRDLNAISVLMAARDQVGSAVRSRPMVGMACPWSLPGCAGDRDRCMVR